MEYLKIQFYDDGKEFTNEDLNNAFKRFYKGHSADISIKNKEGYDGEYINIFK